MKRPGHPGERHTDMANAMAGVDLSPGTRASGTPRRPATAMAAADGLGGIGSDPQPVGGLCAGLAARRLGAEQIILTGGDGTRIVLERVGCREAVETALGAVRDGGTISRVGAPDGYRAMASREALEVLIEPCSGHGDDSERMDERRADPDRTGRGTADRLPAAGRLPDFLISFLSSVCHPPFPCRCCQVLRQESGIRRPLAETHQG